MRQPKPGDRPDELDLDLAWAGALTDADAARVRATPELAAADAEITALARWWAASRPPLPVARPRPRWAPAWILAVAAAVLLVIAAGVNGPPETPDFRAMGSLAVDAAASRDGHPVEIGRLRGGDVVRVSLVPDRDGWLTIGTIEAAGGVSPLVTDVPVRRGARFVLDSGIRLDDHVGTEWLVVTIEPKPGIDLQALRPPSSGPGRAVVLLRGGP